jgi:tetratricopeptide (TPR) repeat protein
MLLLERIVMGLLVLSAAVTAASVPAGDWVALEQAGKKAFAAEDYREAEKQFSESMSIARTFEATDSRLFSSLNNLAAAKTQLGKFNEAVELFDQMKPLREVASLQARIDSDVNHAVLINRRGNPPAALAEFQSSLKMAMEALGPESGSVALVSNHLALYFRDAGRLDEAVANAERALAIREKLFGMQSSLTAVSLGILAQLKQAQGDLLTAEKFCRQVLEMRRAALGEVHGLVAESMSNLAMVLKEQGKYPDAESLYKQAYAIWANARGGVSYEVSLAHNNLAALYTVQGKFKKAEDEFTQSISMMEKVTGPAHPSLAMVLTNFGGLYRIWHKLDRAEVMLNRALQIDETRLGPLHNRVAQDLTALADVSLGRKDYGTAEPLLLRAYAIHQNTSGNSSDSTARTAIRLAMLYQYWARPAEAAPFYQQAMTVWRKPSQADLQVAGALENYSVLLKKSKLYAEAEDAVTVAMGIRVQAAKNGTPNAFPPATMSSTSPTLGQSGVTGFAQAQIIQQGGSRPPAAIQR